MAEGIRKTVNGGGTMLGGIISDAAAAALDAAVAAEKVTPTYKGSTEGEFVSNAILYYAAL